MAESFELEVDWISAGAVGEPGQRTFFLQVRRAGEYVTLLLEKGQVAALAQLAQELLARVDVVVLPDDLDVAAQRIVEPAHPAWRAGALSLGMDEERGRFLLEAVAVGEEDEEPAIARFWMDQSQLVALAAHAAYSVEAGARERCRFCGRPIDPVEGHVCPATNGHGPLTT